MAKQKQQVHGVILFVDGTSVPMPSIDANTDNLHNKVCQAVKDELTKYVTERGFSILIKIDAAETDEFANPER